ncbi:50S ribosomal protein L35 [Ignicoccus islandicus DSM 13165]|uniref:Large ribosomal subunit protein eL33 n=1 Tax=Ignicoccus islandicus DSM 13165 TaxID=940295 RepID=A0A0U3EA73_9CREN|nr:50S ribosomal protein L35ae [Ignicoccus islandicus]ALU11331.1 50S ribosomal protein L35 [Ignicoccus islandicus DSM 13165]
MEAIITSYRRGSNDQNVHQVLVRFPSVNDAKMALGKRIIYEDSKGNKYVGKVLRLHGRKGVAIAVFKPNLPGQALGKVARIE